MATWGDFGKGGISGGLAGAGSGAAIGSAFGPLGTGVGAVVGGLAGALGGVFGAKGRREAKERAAKLRRDMLAKIKQQRIDDNLREQAVFSRSSDLSSQMASFSGESRKMGTYINPRFSKTRTGE